MAFTKEDTNINRNGRPVGSVNKLTDHKRALREAISEEDITSIIETLKQKAKHDKCLTSIRLILEYAIGKPTQHQVQHQYSHGEEVGISFNDLMKKMRGE
jgi:hypothetical protein